MFSYHNFISLSEKKYTDSETKLEISQKSLTKQSNTIRHIDNRGKKEQIDNLKYTNLTFLR